MVEISRVIDNLPELVNNIVECVDRVEKNITIITPFVIPEILEKVATIAYQKQIQLGEVLSVIEDDTRQGYKRGDQHQA
jgi:sugar-specific transcriptional regulator TrmB